MSSARDIRVEPISAQDANRIVRRLHYSGKVDTRSQLHLGVFLNGTCGGALQFGPPIDKRKALMAVPGTPWNAMLDLNRLAFADWLPRNSESRALGYTMRWIKRTYPWMEWVQSYADATQCGDGTIYRASGFTLVSIKRNTAMYRMPDGEVVFKLVFEPGFSPGSKEGSVKARYGKTGSETSGAFLKRIGATPLPGFQLRYMRFFSDAARSRLALTPLDYSEIEKAGATMYLGDRGRSADGGAPVHQPEEAVRT